MNKPKRKASGEKPEELFGRIVSILEEARGNVLRAVNTNMVMAYWLIGREIVEEVQGGEERAAYGKKVIEELSARLNERYGQGFSFRNLELFKQFYLSYKERFTILRPSGAEFGTSQIVRPMGTESSGSEIYLPMGRKLEILSPPGIESGFSPQLSWSHYRALMRVNSVDARDFYEREAIAGGWDKNIGENTQLCCLFRAEGPSRYKPSPEPDSALAEPGSGLGFGNTNTGMRAKGPHRLPEPVRGWDLRGLSARVSLVQPISRPAFGPSARRRTGLVSARTFGPNAADHRLRIVHARQQDNPTIGLILCTEKDDTVARYSVLNDRKQIFASKYMLCLPTEEQLRLEIEKERTLIEAALEERGDA